MRRAAVRLAAALCAAAALGAGVVRGQEAAPERRALVDTDMSLMAGLSPADPMDGMAMDGWMWMGMGVVRAVYDHQGGIAGRTTVDSSNWSMVMGQRRLGPGPLTIHGRGSPQLFQTGEAKDGAPLVDVQHPHDFFMNLSATYHLGLGDAAALWLQVAPRGEPALGPTAFMHRASSGDNPAPPLGHHWQDSTHIATNVLTVGGGWRWLTLEASTFHGREPDERRWNIEWGSWDSVSGRLKLRLGRGFSAQVSHGFLRHPETLVLGDTHRTTASLHYGADGGRPLAVTVVYGRNGEWHGPESSVLAEGAYRMTAHDAVYARFEYVQKDAQLLVDKGFPPGGGEAGVDPIRAFTGGYVRELLARRRIGAGLGADVTVYGFPERLRPGYGDHPVSVHVFARGRWGSPHGHGHHH